MQHKTQHLKDPCKEWQKWFNGYEAQNEGTGPYLSNTYTPPLSDLKMRGKYYCETQLMYVTQKEQCLSTLET